MRKKLVCLCNLVTEIELMEALKKGASSTGDIQKITSAGTTCGRCLPEIDALVENYKKNSGNDQFKLSF
ncbi:MAG: (2Fe-2S)-binding protein [Prolixibacteraceae bacterium]|nr:(2Fe-2S)-binding protein [Prolixibacteraceae bacterium]MBN2773586.1 (2Fe-2S)-binding protein [Prolixibacteraceae bacterium]